MSPQNRPAVLVGTRAQLFVDGYLVERQDRLTERLHPAVKHPGPVLCAEAPWESPGRSGVAGPVSAHFDPHERLYKLWYVASGPVGEEGPSSAARYQLFATSTDGLHFERPSLGLTSFDGSTANNILVETGGKGPKGVFTGTVPNGMLDTWDTVATEGPQYRYKALRPSGRVDRRSTHSVAFSSDGLRWTDYPGNPVIRGLNHGDTSSALEVYQGPSQTDPPWLPTAKYAAFHKIHLVTGGTDRRCIGMSACLPAEAGSGAVPFTQWDESVLVLAPDELDDELARDRLDAGRSVLLYDHPDDRHCEFYSMVVFRSGDVFLGLVRILDVSFEVSRLGGRNQYGLLDVQLVASRDLVHWHRCGKRRSVLERGEPGTFDSTQIGWYSAPVPAGDEQWVYYAGHDTGHHGMEHRDPVLHAQYLADVRAGRRRFPAIGLGKFRRDGFVSLDAGTSGGTLVTRALRPGGTRLEINAAVRGDLRVEVQDENGRPLPGHSAVECTTVTGDSVRHAVHWGDRVGDAAWGERTVKLVFHLRDAQLFAFRFAGTSEGR